MSQIVQDILGIARCGTQYRSDALAPMGLKSCHASYLVQICACPGISQDQLAQKICINKSNVARQVVILEEGGFITRKPCDEDKRVMKLYPTEKTQQLLPEIISILNDWEACLTQDLSPEELALLGPLLERMKIRAVAWMDAR